MYSKRFYVIYGKLARMGFDLHDDFVLDLLKVYRLALRHDRLAEMSCNGVGYIRGQVYSMARIDDYERRTHGHSVKSAYIKEGEENTIFDVESEKIEAKITAICEKWHVRADFQGDPRGYTVRLTLGTKDITESVFNNE